MAISQFKSLNATVLSTPKAQLKALNLQGLVAPRARCSALSATILIHDGTKAYDDLRPATQCVSLSATVLATIIEHPAHLNDMGMQILADSIGDLTDVSATILEIPVAKLSDFGLHAIEMPVCRFEDLSVTVLVDNNYAWNMGEVTKLAWCLKLTRSDSLVMGFTSRDEDIVIGDVTYKANTGFCPAAVATARELAADSAESQGAVTSEEITLQDIAMGKYDGAQVVIFLCDWQRLDAEDPFSWSNLNNETDWLDRRKAILVLRKGSLGQVSGNRDSFKAEVRGLLQGYQQKAVAIYSNWCRADFCDPKCGLKAADYTFAGTVTAINEDGSIAVDVQKDSYYFNYGLLTFTSGKCMDCLYDIKDYTVMDGTARVLSFLPFDDEVQVGDIVSLLAGCDGNLDTCIQKFNNVANFRGEPYVPGSDYLMTYPNKGGG